MYLIALKHNRAVLKILNSHSMIMNSASSYPISQKCKWQNVYGGNALEAQCSYRVVALSSHRLRWMDKPSTLVILIFSNPVAMEVSITCSFFFKHFVSWCPAVSLVSSSLVGFWLEVGEVHLMVGDHHGEDDDDGDEDEDCEDDRGKVADNPSLTSCVHCSRRLHVCPGKQKGCSGLI